jgi:hypothetical protein
MLQLGGQLFVRVLRFLDVAVQCGIELPQWRNGDESSEYINLSSVQFSKFRLYDTNGTGRVWRRTCRTVSRTVDPYGSVMPSICAPTVWQMELASFLPSGLTNSPVLS